MSPEEYLKMIETGEVQESINLGMTNVTYPARSDAFKAAKPGTYYVEFEIDKNAMHHINPSDPHDCKIFGPSSIFKSLFKNNKMPDFKNLQIKQIK